MHNTDLIKRQRATALSGRTMVHVTSGAHQMERAFGTNSCVAALFVQVVEVTGFSC